METFLNYLSQNIYHVSIISTWNKNHPKIPKRLLLYFIQQGYLQDFAYVKEYVSTLYVNRVFITLCCTTKLFSTIKVKSIESILVNVVTV